MIHMRVAQASPVILFFILCTAFFTGAGCTFSRPALRAVEASDLEALQYALSQDPEDEDVRAALALASKNGAVDFVHAILDSGAEPTSIAASIAFATANDKIGRLLIEHGAHPNGAVVVSAARRNDLDLLRFLFDHGADPNAAEESSALKVTKYADGSFVVSAERDPHGWTPLGVAVDLENTEMVRLLLANGADPNALFIWKDLDAHGPTPRSLQRLGFHLPRGAREPIPEERTRSLILAVRKQAIDIVELLLDFGADVFAADSRGLNAVIVADELGNSSLRKILTRAGA